MSTAVYARYELLRTFRNLRFFGFSLAFPLILFLLVAGPNRHQELDGVAFPVYYMSGMVAWGTMTAIVASGARIAAERAVGWNRQLRITPLSTSTYIGAKVATGYAMALASIAILYTAGIAVGVRLDAGQWLTMTALILGGLVPFAALGIAVGHLIGVDAMGPALGGLVSLFALLGGAWGPLATAGWLHDLAQMLPSYWLVQAGKVALGGGAWPLRAWVVVAIWTLALTRLAVWAFRRDTQRA